MRRIITLFLASILLCIATTASAASLRRQIYSDVRTFDGKIGLYARNLVTGKTLDINEHDIFPTASTSKLVVAAAIYKYIYPKATAGKKNTYDDYIRSMMVYSDNVSFSELLSEFDASYPDVLSKVTKDLRLQKTKIHSEEAFRKHQYHSVTTAYEMGKVMEAIYQDQYLGKEKSSLMRHHLANTIFQDEIPRFMLTKVMHKIGQLDDVLCDVGVVDDGKDQIIISVYTQTGKPEQYASDFIATISAKLYNELRRK